MRDQAEKNTELTLSQRVQVGVAAGASSSFINHPFQVLRSRFQNHVAIKEKFPLETPPEIFPSELRTLFKGFSATLLSMCCLTVTQSIAKKIVHDMHGDDFSSSLYLRVWTPLTGGALSALLTTPLEGGILRQSKTLTQSVKGPANQGIFRNTYSFYKDHGLKRSYVGCSIIAVRTSIVGSGFAVWMPIISDLFEKQGLSHNLSMYVAGVISGLFFAAASQPAETIRIEQQFSADEKNVLTVRKAAMSLINKNGYQGLFKGGSYRIPRTAPGVLINGIVYEKLERHFSNMNNYSK
ncbi:MAG: MC/SLC25 family protein [Pseudomonadota bacterium]